MLHAASSSRFVSNRQRNTSIRSNGLPLPERFYGCSTERRKRPKPSTWGSVHSLVSRASERHGFGVAPGIPSICQRREPRSLQSCERAANGHKGERPPNYSTAKQHAHIPHQAVIILDEVDPLPSPMKAKARWGARRLRRGAALWNAVYSATRMRVRYYPIRERHVEHARKVGQTSAAYACGVGTWSNGHTAALWRYDQPSAAISGLLVRSCKIVTIRTVLQRAQGRLLLALLSTVLALTVVAPAAFAQAIADLGVTKTGPETAPADSDVTYMVTIFNGGPDTATNVTLNDPIPAGMTFVSATQNTGPAFSCATPAVGGTGTIACTNAAMPPSATATFAFVLHIPAGTPSATSFTNIATATTDAFDPNDENNAGVAATTTPAVIADLAVTKTAPGVAAPDTDVTFTISVTNGGPAAAIDVTLVDPLPAGTTFVSLVQNSGPAMSCTTPAVGSGGTVTCTAATLAAGATAAFALTAHVAPDAVLDEFLTNIASVSGASFDPNVENNAGAAAVLVSQVDVAVTKTGPAVASGGANLSYTLTVSNAGPSIANDVVLTDALPPGTTFVSLVQQNGPAPSCVAPAVGTTGTIQCSFSTFGPGASAQFLLTINTGAAASISNTATVSTASFDTDPGNGSSTVTTAVNQSADLGVSKTGPATIIAGGSAAYSLTVTNAGPSAAANVTLTDPTPTNTTFSSLEQTSGPAFSCATPAVGGTGTIACSLASLAPGGTATFSVVLRQSASTPAGTSTSNMANVATSTSDPDAANNAASATSVVTAAPVAPEVIPVPTLSWFGLLLVIVSLGTVAARSLPQRVRRP